MLLAAERPKWIPVSVMVPKGSIGSRMIEEIPTLGERLRPETTLNQPFTRNSLLKAGSFFHFQNYRDLLSASEHFGNSVYTGPLRSFLYKYLNNLLILPHTRLLSAMLWDQKAYVVPPDREREIKEGVEAAMNRLCNQRQVSILTMHFGLDRGFPLSFAEIHSELGKYSPSRQVLQRLADKGLLILRSRAAGPSVRDLLPLPESSIGRAAFGPLTKDIPQLKAEERVYALGFSPEVLEALEKNNLGYMVDWTIEKLIFSDLSYEEGFEIFSWIKRQISDSLKKRAMEVAEENMIRELTEIHLKDQRSGEVLYQEQLKEIERRSQIEESKDNFISEFKLTASDLEEFDNLQIGVLGLTTRTSNILARVGVRTIGLLLRVEKKDFQKLPKSGKVTKAEILEKLTLFLESQKTGE